MVDRPGPTLRRRKLVKELVAARSAAGLSVRQLASEIDLQGGTISKIESGKQGLTVRNIKAIGRATGLNKAKVDQLLLLAADDDNNDDWLVEFREGIPDWFALYPELEQDADQIWTYSTELVDGLCQTADYAEAIIRAGLPNITDPEVRRIIDVRRARQTLFERESPPRLHLILNEAAVRRPIGGDKVMREQIRHLIMIAHRWHVEIQVLPFEVGAHPGMKSGFTLLRFPEGFDDMDCVYLENENGGIWQEVAEHVARYSEIFDRLRNLALSPDETRSLLTSLA